MPPHNHGPYRLYVKVAKTLGHTPSATQNMPRWHPSLVKTSLVHNTLSLSVPASAAYLNRQLRTGSPRWPVSFVIGSADHRYRWAYTARKRVRPRPRCLHAAHLT